jgi:hypothetical protein
MTTRTTPKEIEREEQRQAAARATAVKIEHRRQLKKAAPEMWKALNALAKDLTSEHTHESIRTGPHVCLILNTLAKAGPQPELES